MMFNNYLLGKINRFFFAFKQLEIKKYNGSGFTLVEVIIVIGIALILSVILLSIFVDNSNIFQQQSSKIERGIEANDALGQIRNQIKQAKLVALTYPETAPFTYTSSSNILILKVPSLDSSENIILNTFDYSIFLKDNETLKWVVIPDPISFRPAVNQVIAKNVLSIYFYYLNKDDNNVSFNEAVKIKAILTFRQKAGITFETTEVATEARLRND